MKVLYVPMFVLLMSLETKSHVMYSIILPQQKTQISMNAKAERSWKPFYNAFRAAVRKRDRKALKKMMAREFLYSLGGGDDNVDGDNRDDAFRFWDAHQLDVWEKFDKVLARGAVPFINQDGLHNHRLTYIAHPSAGKRQGKEKAVPEWYAVFEFHEDEQ